MYRRAEQEEIEAILILVKEIQKKVQQSFMKYIQWASESCKTAEQGGFTTYYFCSRK